MDNLEVWHQRANAISMVPFFIVANRLPYPLVSLSIHVLWISAFCYHWCLSNQDYEAAKQWYMGDLGGQMVLVSLIAYYCDFIPRFYLPAIIYTCIKAFVTQNMFYVIQAHALLTTLGVVYKPRVHLKTALLLALAGLTYYIDTHGIPFSWSIGHVLLSWYTARFVVA